MMSGAIVHFSHVANGPIWIRSIMHWTSGVEGLEVGSEFSVTYGSSPRCL